MVAMGKEIWLRPFFCIAVVFLFSGCASLQVPKDTISVLSMPSVRTQQHGLTVEAFLIQGTEEYWGLFDEELPKFGIAAIWIRLRNDSGDPVDLSHIRWRLQTKWSRFPSLNAEEVFSRYHKQRGARIVHEHSDQVAQEQLRKKIFRAGRLSPRQQAEGFVFIRIHPQGSATWSHGHGQLVASEIMVDSRRRVSLEVSLTGSEDR